VITSTEDIIDAIDATHPLAEEAETRLYQFKSLNKAIDDLIEALHNSAAITLEPQVLFALTDIFTLREEINIDD
jgi:hypothetical protein|tara:strand:- start:1451 stop:1672 length:222 start_codon:yes stop_codon:yes gene_type:complete